MRRFRAVTTLAVVLAATGVPVAGAEESRVGSSCSIDRDPAYWIVDERGIQDRHGGTETSRCGDQPPTTSPPAPWQFRQEPTATPVVGVDGRPGGLVKVTSRGGVFTFGTTFHGSAAGRLGAGRATDIGFAGTRDGYRVVTEDGAVHGFGDAPVVGSLSGRRLASPIVAVAGTPTGGGYWLAAAGGGVFAFGDARYRGSLGGRDIGSEVVAIAATPRGDGYWLVTEKGGVFPFGAAGFHGSAGGVRLASPVVDLVPTESGAGYWLLTAAGGVLAFGDAEFVGRSRSADGTPFVGMVRISN